MAHKCANSARGMSCSRTQQEKSAPKHCSPHRGRTRHLASNSRRARSAEARVENDVGGMHSHHQNLVGIHGIRIIRAIRRPRRLQRCTYLCKRTKVMHRHRDDKKRNFNDIYPVHRQIHIQEPDFQLLTRIRRSQPKASFSKGANTVPATPNRAKNNMIRDNAQSIHRSCA